MDESDPQPQPTRGEEVTSRYANNTLFEPTVWDLKIIFGEYSRRAAGTEWHTSITLPWAQAKLMAYYLGINIAAHELRAGLIRIPDSMRPAQPPPPLVSPQSGKEDPDAQAFFKMVSEHHQKFLESLK